MHPLLLLFNHINLPALSRKTDPNFFLISIKPIYLKALAKDGFCRCKRHLRMAQQDGRDLSLP